MYEKVSTGTAKDRHQSLSFPYVVSVLALLADKVSDAGGHNGPGLCNPVLHSQDTDRRIVRDDSQLEKRKVSPVLVDNVTVKYWDTSHCR